MDNAITTNNFSEIRKLIQAMIDQFRINAEKWVVDQFNDIPEHPADGAVMSLREVGGKIFNAQTADRSFCRDRA